MRFEKFMTEKQIDEEILFKQAKSLDDVVLGENTWFFIENPLVEGSYYPITNALNEDEINHFSLLNEISREEKAARKEKIAAFKAAKEVDPKDEWTQEIEKAYKDIMDKSRKSFHKLDNLAKKSYVIKYIMHGLETSREKEDWGRTSNKAGKSPKELYADSLKSYKEKQKFIADVMAMMRDEELKQRQAIKQYNAIKKRYKSLVDLEISLGKSTDGLTQKLAVWAKDKFSKGWYAEKQYMQFLWKIRAKQYNSLKELSDCVKQFNAIENNTKTVKSIDITTVCPKREKLLQMQQEYANAEAQVIQAIEDGASESTINQLKKRAEQLKVTDANNPTCAYCYVEQGREIQDENPNYIYAKASKRGQTYQDTFQNWIKKDKGKPVVDKDGNYVLTVGGQKSREMLNKMGGLRFFSSGDYIEDEATDTQIERIIKDAEKVGLQLKAITKQEKFVKKYGGRKFESGPLKGKPVFNINMSVDELLGFKLEIAKYIKKQYPGNVNIRVVARNPEEAIRYSKEKEVDVITLLHFGKRTKRMSNKDLYVDMTTGSEGWKRAMEGMKKAHPRENWNKIFSKICCQMDGKGDCRKCPNACGFNPRRVADYTQLAKGGKMALKN